MKQPRLWACVCLATLLLTGGLFAQKSLDIGSATGTDVTLPVTLTSDEGVQGLVLSVGVDAMKLTATDIRAAGATIANNAELIVGEVLPDGVTLGVVMDFNPPYDGQEIPTGSDQLIAEVDLTALVVLPCGDTETIAVNFQDGLNSPPLANILVVDGMSIGETEGLALNGGAVTVRGGCDTIRAVATTGEKSATNLSVPIEVDNTGPVEGYVVSLAHAAGVELVSIDTAGTDAGAVGIEFEVAQTYVDGGTLGVVFDFETPYDGQTLPPASGNTLANFNYQHAPFECTDDPAADALTYDLTFVDGVFGSPPLSNVLVKGGMSIAPTLKNGAVTFQCTEPAGIDYFVGADTGGEEPAIVCAVGSAGGEAKVTFYYTSDSQPIQGMSMAVCFPPALDVADLDGAGQGMVGATHLDGTITDGINAEFVSFNADNTAGELIIGILVDSTPPIPINHMYPPRDTPGKVLNVFFNIPASAECNTEYALTFCDGATGAGTVPIYNRAAVFNESMPVRTHAGCLVVGGKAAFIRGDCNTDQWVDIADPAATMSYLFLGVFDPSCLDACDSNDDGVVDLADVTATLRFLFKLGPILPPPGPYAPGGQDPTDDIYGLDLGCESGDPCNGN